MDGGAKTAEASLQVFQFALAVACGTLEAERGFRHRLAHAAEQRLAHQELLACHQQLAAESFAQPPGEPHVIWMHMSADDPLQRPSAHEAGKQSLPELAAGGEVETGVD